MLVTADWHLDDNTINEYRWNVFDSAEGFMDETGVDTLYLLGDVTDRKDRHSGELVNRLVDGFTRLTKRGRRVVILQGNHDAPMKGSPFWRFLGRIPGLSYITKPYAETHGNRHLLLLPAVLNPAEAWAGIQFNLYSALFMHQPVRGATAENGWTLKEDDKMPLLPRSLSIYSGDIHTPQRIRGVTYVGAPHLCDYGDEHKCRMLRLNNSFEIVEELKLQSPKKITATIESINDLKDMRLHKGDQVRVEFKIDPDRLEQFAADKMEITSWSQQRGIVIASIKGHVQTVPVHGVRELEEDAPDEDVLEEFAHSEGLDDDLIDTGLNIIRERATHV